VDVDMWEKIILNLLSNALKYSTKGRISVRLAQKDERMILSVTDTGVGIPKEEVNKIFERFHRIQNVQGRSQEGTGIGLALVQELVKLHHGTITVDSEVGKGSTFTISLPIGNEHLPPEKIRTTNGDTGISTRVDAYVEEALKWLPSHNGTNGEVSLVMDSEFPGTKITNKESRPTILLADDNADMRAYVKRLLIANYHVEAVENGALALQKLEELVPDLVLSDVMMPDIDGFELVKRLKSAKHTSHIPVILLSARAGEEATIEGLQTGADDYLVKPFSARELVTRIDSNIKIAKARNNAARQLHHLFMQAPVAICILKGPEFIIELANDTVLKIWGKPGSIIGMPVLKAIPEIKDTYYPELLKEVYEKGITHYANENSADFIRNGITEKVYFNFVYQPMYEVDGRISGILVAANEVTELVEARKKIEDAEERLRMAAEGTGLGTWDLNLLTSEIIYSRRLNELFGYPLSHRLLHEEMRSHIHPDDVHAIVEKAFDAAMANGNYYYEARVVWKDGSQKWIRTRGKVIYNEEQKPVRMLGTMIDITAEKEAEIRLRESEEKYRQLAQELETRVDQRTRDFSESNSNLERSNKELEQFAFVTSHDLQEPLRKIQTFGNMLHDHYEGAIGEKGKNYLEKMLNASQRMSKLINDLLNFSRLRQSEGYVATDLNELLANIKNDFELVINQKKAVIKHDRLPVIDANPLQMNQLFYNLLSNALKFTNENTVPVIEIHCLETNSERVKEFPYLNKDKKYFEVVFTDNGIGFPQEYAKKIFEIFQRLNARSEYEGTGIGLALVNKIVDNHKGIVYARSEEGKGSAFHILLPAKQE
jgi:PAS domain S-box-containing protein